MWKKKATKHLAKTLDVSGKEVLFMGWKA